MRDCWYYSDDIQDFHPRGLDVDEIKKWRVGLSRRNLYPKAGPVNTRDR